MPKLKLRKGKIKTTKDFKKDIPKKNTKHEYRQGGEGMIKWCNDHVRVPIYPEDSVVAAWYPMNELPTEPNPATGKSYATIWKEQQAILREALRMENGRFVYSNIVFCWMRGEGKSLLACLIQLWKFFNWPRQQIMLGANSKDQIKFVHFDIMKDIISYSPKLLRMVGGLRNLQEKEIRFKGKDGKVRSLIRSISSFTGIVSNITGYTFSEIFDMKNPKFYTQLDGSIRNMPNALGVIDSTVSEKTHILYTLYENAMKGKTKRVYFSYRSSETGNMEDYWNPHMSQTQLDDYKAKFPFGDYERYFLNLWSAGTQRIFSDEAIEGTKVLAIDGERMNTKKIMLALKEKNHLIRVAGNLEKKGKSFVDGVIETEGKINAIDERITPVTSVYSLTSEFRENIKANMQHLSALSDLFDTDWALLAGVDFGDPLAVRGLARTILTFMVKGLPNSRSKNFVFLDEGAAPKYIYFMMYAVMIENHSMDIAKEIIEDVHEEFDGIDMFCSERYRAWDMVKWCEDRDIGFEPIYPNYERQKEAFKELLLAVNEGRWKCPPIAIKGSKMEDIRDEEMEVFTHNMDKKWFGSGEKMEKYGIQDDFIFSSGWAMYGGRMIGVDMFRPRKSAAFFGSFTEQEGLIGNYV